VTREQSWKVGGATLSILRMISSLGYTVSVHRIPSSLLGRMGAFVEMHAVDLRADPPVQQMARIGVEDVADAEVPLCVPLGASGWHSFRRRMTAITGPAAGGRHAKRP
jgi:hypothetical protein